MNFYVPEGQEETSVSADLSGVERESVVGEGGGEPGEREDERTFANSWSPDHRQDGFVGFVVVDIR